MPGSQSTVASWDYGLLDAGHLKDRATFYASAAGAGEVLRASLTELLDSDLGKAVVAISEQELFGMVLNDFYKPKMHKLYSALYTAVEADFQLKIRKTPFTLERISDEDPKLFASYQKQVEDTRALVPDLQEQRIILDTYSGFNMSQAAEERSLACCVAPVSWDQSSSGQPLLVASGPVEAASNAETSITQITQQYIIRAQARDLLRRQDIRIDRTERVANSLGNLLGVLQKLLAAKDSGVKMALFAGRRSTDRTFLLLQNLLCTKHLPNYLGTSSVYAITLIDRTARLGVSSPEQRHALTGSLVGTHAHELMMMTTQLLSRYDDMAGAKSGNPVPVAALLAHLLFLREVGGLAAPTALSDTFGTRAFVETALRTELPAEFLEDMRERHPSVVAHLPTEPVVFDMFSSWRLDSGSYPDMAEVVVSAWESRCLCLAPEDSKPPRPQLMHSNLGSVEEVLEVCRLPQRIRPAACAFGSLTDGFLPFHLEDGRTAEIHAASIVMKSVQARLPSSSAVDSSALEGSAKLGDDEDKGKAQVDARLPLEAQERLKQRMARMFAVRDVDSSAASAALKAAYHDVTCKHILCQQ
ncbi:g2715 [Coccomyxa viridis]|uniref:G2715 protein n=1 Tax=Coccomyxa viridis TaxID=1274662 RepID=A0ABP1FPQ5_9CHLO